MKLMTPKKNNKKYFRNPINCVYEGLFGFEPFDKWFYDSFAMPKGYEVNDKIKELLKTLSVPETIEEMQKFFKGLKA